MTDLARWTALSREPESPWAERLRLLAAGIQPGETVIDVGAGGRGLRDLIDPSCLYLPVDCVPGSPIVHDFNTGTRPPRLNGTVAVMSGILEYIYAPAEALRTVATWCPRILLSYAAAHVGDLPEISARKAGGWVNHMTVEDLGETFRDLGFEAEMMSEWKGQGIWEVRR